MPQVRGRFLQGEAVGGIEAHHHPDRGNRGRGNPEAMGEVSDVRGDLQARLTSSGDVTEPGLDVVGATGGPE